MRISDWSSDVCSSDLHEGAAAQRALRVEYRLHKGFEIARLLENRHLLAQAGGAGLLVLERPDGDGTQGHAGSGLRQMAGQVMAYAGLRHQDHGMQAGDALVDGDAAADEIGRASCRERVCQYV